MNENPPKALLEKAAQDISGAFATRFCAIGVEFNLFHEIKKVGPISSEKLAKRVNLSERYIREWIYGTALAGYVTFDKVSREVSLTEDQELLFTSPGNRFSQHGAFQVANSALIPYEELKSAFRNGGGVSFQSYPEELWNGLDHTGCTRYRNFLMEDWLPKLTKTVDKLSSGCSFADLGCGVGRSTIELAKKFKQSKFFGYDAYEKNIHTARQYSLEAGVENNVEFHHWNVSQGSPGVFDVVATFDLIHDLPDPEEGLRIVKKSMSQDGVFLLMDIEATDDPIENSGPLTLFKLGMSLHFCMTTAMWQGGYGIGTVGLTPKVLRELCKKVGFVKVKKIKIDHPLNSLYEIV